MSMMVPFLGGGGGDYKYVVTRSESDGNSPESTVSEGKVFHEDMLERPGFIMINWAFNTEGSNTGGSPHAPTVSVDNGPTIELMPQSSWVMNGICQGSVTIPFERSYYVSYSLPPSKPMGTYQISIAVFQRYER